MARLDTGRTDCALPVGGGPASLGAHGGARGQANLGAHGGRTGGIRGRTGAHGGPAFPGRGAGLGTGTCAQA